MLKLASSGTARERRRAAVRRVPVCTVSNLQTLMSFGFAGLTSLNCTVFYSLHTVLGDFYLIYFFQIVQNEERSPPAFLPGSSFTLMISDRQGFAEEYPLTRGCNCFAINPSIPFSTLEKRTCRGNLNDSVVPPQTRITALVKSAQAWQKLLGSLPPSHCGTKPKRFAHGLSP